MDWFPVQCAKNRPVPEPGSASLAKRPHLKSRFETHPGVKKSAGGSISASSTDARKKGGHGGWNS